MHFMQPQFLGQVRLVMGQTPPPAPPPAPVALPVSVQQFQAMSGDERTAVLNTLTNEQACLLYQQLYALTGDPQDQQYMNSWCNVAAG